LWGERWAKLCQNAMGNPVQAMSGLGSLEIASSEVGRAITIHLGAESARVGVASGYKIPKFGGATAEQWADAGRRETYDALDRMLTPTSSGSSRSWRASMGQDITKGRPTEIDYMNGHVVAQGQTRGVPTPVSAAVVDMVHEVETGARQAVPQNIQTTLRRAGIYPPPLRLGPAGGPAGSLRRYVSVALVPRVRDHTPGQASGMRALFQQDLPVHDGVVDPFRKLSHPPAVARKVVHDVLGDRPN